jgi:hypothetical protein
MLGKVNAMAVAAVLAAGAGGALTAQPAQAQPGVAVPCSTGGLARAGARAAPPPPLGQRHDAEPGRRMRLQPDSGPARGQPGSDHHRQRRYPAAQLCCGHCGVHHIDGDGLGHPDR